MRLRISPRKATRLLLLVIDGFVLLHLAAAWIELEVGHERWLGSVAFVRQFDLDREANLPALFSVGLLAACSLLLAILASRAREADDPFRRHWVALSGLFALLAVDEGCELHELLGAPIRNLLGLDGYLYYAWVLPGALVVAAIGVTFARFLRHLPPAERRLVVAAAALYLGGALGIEMVGGQHADRLGTRTFGYACWTAIEESLEMLGSVLFLIALARRLGLEPCEIRISFAPPAVVVDRAPLSRRVAGSRPLRPGLPA